MIYTDLVKKACMILFEAHRDDKDKGGYPYVFHPFYLATKMETEEEICVALLHDVIEDHNDKYSIESLELEGFGKNIIEALRLLTHNNDILYMDYVMKLAKNKYARKVKIEDLKHNMDLTRTGGIKSSKYKIYQEALEYLINYETNLIQR